MQAWSEVECQETSILYGRSEDMVYVTTSDLTQMNRLDKLANDEGSDWECCNEMWQDGKIVFKEYRAPKSLLSFRRAIAKRELSEEQKRAIGERLGKARGNATS